MSNQRQASSASQVPHLSPAELSYLYTSLSLPKNPIRPDGRSPTQYRPLSAETNILPGTNGSARIGFADGTQAIVGVKAEVEKTVLAADTLDSRSLAQHGDALNREGEEGSAAVSGQGEWVQMSIEIPGFRDDDALPVFLGEMMRESLVGSVENKDEMAGGLKGRLVINKRWHWRLYIDVCVSLFGIWLHVHGTNILYSRFFSSPNLSLTRSPSSPSLPTSHYLAPNSRN
jgi:exosome complex component RRP42